MSDKNVLIKPCMVKDIVEGTGFHDLMIANSKDPSIINKDLTSPTPRIDIYYKLEEQGLFRIVGAFDGDTVIGYIGFTAYIHPLTGDKIGTVDPYFILRKFRNKGLGDLMVNALKTEARKLGLKGLFFGAPKGSALSKKLANDDSYKHVNEVFWCKL